MPQITISVHNAELVSAKLRNIRAAIPRITRDDINVATKKIVKEMRSYPSPPAGSRYTRTYKLKNSWRIKPSPTGSTVVSDAVRKGRHYTRYVVGYASGKGQARVHLGRWLLFRDVAEYYVSRLPRTIEEHLKIKVKSEGL